jgi:BMFP domain-containing protein YqiC
MTSPAVPAWFYHVTGKDWWSNDTKNLNDAVQVYKDDKQAEYIVHEINNALDHVMANDEFTREQFNSAVAVILQARESLAAAHTKLSLELTRAKKAVEANKYLEKQCEQLLTNILQSQDMSQLVAHDYEIKLKLKPGQLKSSAEPTIKDLQVLGEAYIRQKLEWNIANIKAGLATGDISHTWATEKGFELVREQSISIKKLETENA